MKNNALIVAALVLGVGLGLVTARMSGLSGVIMTGEPAANDSAQQVKSPLYWVAPMDPSFRSDKPGKSPMGMDLVPVYDNGADNGGSTVTISPEVVNNLGVRTTQVQRGPLAQKIRTVGYLDYDETRISHIHPRTEGWIERLSVRAEGEQVKHGQLLFELYAPTLVNAQEEYLQALGAGNKILIEASHERLRALGVSSSQIDHLNQERKVAQYIKFYAPQSGVLSRLNVREGMFVKPDTEVMSLANLDQVWLLAEVFEKQANWVKVDQTAEARLPSLPGRLWSGKVEYIYPELDPKTRTLRVRIRFNNAERFLMPNMYAHVEIHSEPRNNVLSIPREALIRGEKHSRVIIALGKGRFAAREVTAGIESGNNVEIRSGLQESDEVVVSGQFLIDSEASLKASLDRLQAVESDDSDMIMDPGAHDHD